MLLIGQRCLNKQDVPVNNVHPPPTNIFVPFFPSHADSKIFPSHPLPSPNKETNNTNSLTFIFKKEKCQTQSHKHSPLKSGLTNQLCLLL